MEKAKPTIFLDIDGVVNTPINLHKMHREYMHNNRFLFKKLDSIKKRLKNRIDHIPQNSISKIKDLYTSRGYRDEYGQLFDDRSIRHLEYVLDKTGADIVISSTWRYSGLKIMQDMWKYRMLPGKVVGITCHSWEVSDKIKMSDYCDNYGDRKSDDLVRGHEIKQYCEDHGITNYVIFDDDVDMLRGQMDRFICTYGKWGLKKEHAIKAVKILNGKGKTNSI